MLDPSIISLLVQIPLVGIFIFFVIRTQKDQSERESKRDETWTKTLDRMSNNNKATLEQLMVNFTEQNKMWRQSLSDQGERFGGDLQEISYDVKNMKLLISRQNAVLTALIVKASNGDKDSMNRLIEVLTDERIIEK